MLKRTLSYLASFRGLVDAVCALAVPLALAFGAQFRTAWLLAVFWLVKVVPGIPGLRKLRRALVLESRPLLSVLLIFLLILFLGLVAVYFLERHCSATSPPGRMSPRPSYRDFWYWISAISAS